MLDSTSYLIAWAVYMSAAVVLLILWWRLTRRRKGLLQILLRLLPAAWILAPVSSVVHENWWMPAVIVATLGVIADGWALGSRGLAALLVATLAALAGSLVGWLWQRRRHRASAAGVNRNSGQPAAT